MTFSTIHNIGDNIVVDGVVRTIVSMHVYVAMDGSITERHYLGNQEWYTFAYRN